MVCRYIGMNTRKQVWGKHLSVTDQHNTYTKQRSMVLYSQHIGGKLASFQDAWPKPDYFNTETIRATSSHEQFHTIKLPKIYPS